MKTEKTGRNDPCYCGSGKKYKKCHLIIENQSPLPEGQIASGLKKLGQRKTCLAPQNMRDCCTTKIIKAHTVSKSASLTEIAVDGHVLSVKETIENKGLNKRFQLQKIGINKASTFTGFCSKHDAEIFSPIENQELTMTPQSCFLLAFRALAKELYIKENYADFGKIISQIGRGAPKESQIILSKFASYQKEQNELAINDLTKIYLPFCEALNKNNYDDICNYIIEFDSNLPVLGCAPLAPVYDFNDCHIQSLEEKYLSHIIFNSVTSNNKGYFIITWLKKENKKINQFIKSLNEIPNEKIWTSLVKYMFISSENVYVSPEWWASLGKKEKEKIEQYIMSGMSNSMRYSYSPDDSELDFGKLKVINKYYLPLND